ncbi:sulfatase [Paraglaciecola sp. T6c]|uniref:sulfatase family protein n=1 Tax=Pseudoalteromonas atlantica (strain T6c / ATCC BAA-1087) TaxID=3042615 RepID=UPI00005C7420|nr:arylsulfatase [Paraglaciecola sp. T6c]ABG39357.1 sulfatase [Paraglaciecola sp. T6c]
MNTRYKLSILSMMFLLILPHYVLGNPEQPDIVVILADDIGLGDISYYTDTVLQQKPVVRTANIDALAQQGVWINDAHSATALCAPTRYAVMTGNNNYRSKSPWGVWGSFQPNAIASDAPTLGNVTQKVGYKTAFVGKWHLGGDFMRTDGQSVFRGSDEGFIPDVDLSVMVAGGPNDLGFDYSYMLPDGIQGPLYLAYENQRWAPLSDSSNIIHVNQQTVTPLKTISDKGDGMGDSAWDTSKIGDLLSAKAVEFIRGQPIQQPLFLYYASPMAHLPHMPPAYFDGEKVAGSTPSAHLDMIHELDLQVKRIVSALKSTGRYKDTLIIFTSDNGGLTYRVPGTLASGHRPSGDYRGSKNSAYEGGHRVPFIVSWPNALAKGGQLTLPVLVQDILATVAAAAGTPMDISEAPDSKNLLPLLTGQAQQERHFMMLQGGSNNELIYRQGEWKLIMQSDHKLSKIEPIALFNLHSNHQERESKNLLKSPEHQSRIKSMLADYKQIRQSGIATVSADG